MARCKEIWGIVAEESKRIILSLNSQQVHISVFSKQQRNKLARVLPTVSVEECGEILKQMERCRERVLNKPCEQLCHSIIFILKLASSVPQSAILN